MPGHQNQFERARPGVREGRPLNYCTAVCCNSASILDRAVARFGCGPAALRLRLAVLMSCLAFAAASRAAADQVDSFESAETSWRLAEADCVVRLAVHERTFQAAHSGNACEYLRLTAGQGTYAHLALPVERARVIAEWAASVWVKSDRPGIQFMARVVLPRSLDSRTGLPLTAPLRGDLYQRVGAWQQLSLPRPDQLLDRQVRILRSQVGPQVESRDAYVDLVMLNVYGGAGTTNLWIDDLQLSGQVSAMDSPSPRQPQRGVPGAGDDSAGVLPVRAPGSERVRLQGSKLVVDGRPLFVRAIESSGEPLEHLRGLGFNAVRLPAAPRKFSCGRPNA